jgi:hypothetical protein
MEKRIYNANEGMTYRRRVDGHIMGNKLILGKFIDGTDDVIENYEEVVDENPRQRGEYRRPISPRKRMLEKRANARRK